MQVAGRVIGLERSSAKCQLQRIGGIAIQRSDVDKFRRRTCLGNERRQPGRPEGLVIGQLALVEDDHNGKVLGCGTLKKPLDGGVVVFLLCQHGDQDIGRLPQFLGPFPVDHGIAVDVG
ncbi:MAG: hypothetical protein CMJ65_14095 [Planctomycetaceae bacterium]|nr:hypothetical protein [Planctomycetaceae bacterium]